MEKIFENTKDDIYNGLKEIIENHNNIKINNEIILDENEEIINKIKNILGE